MRSDSKETGFTAAHSLRSQSLLVETPWLQELEAAGHMLWSRAVHKQEAKSTECHCCSVPFSVSGSQPGNGPTTVGESSYAKYCDHDGPLTGSPRGPFPQVDLDLVYLPINTNHHSVFLFLKISQHLSKDLASLSKLFMNPASGRAAGQDSPSPPDHRHCSLFRFGILDCISLESVYFLLMRVCVIVKNTYFGVMEPGGKHESPGAGVTGIESRLGRC